MPHPNNFPVFLHIMEKNDKKALEIRKLTTEAEAIKVIIDAALLNQPIVVFPVFTNRLRAISALMKHGILEYDHKNNCYRFLI